MTSIILVGMALVFLSFVALLTAAEAAFNFLPRHEAEQSIGRSKGKALAGILENPIAHMRALRFWRVWFEMAAAVAVAVVLHSLLDNVWLAGLAATGIMAVIGFVLVGVSPRQLGRAHSGPVVRFTAPLIRFLCWILGPIPGWLVALGQAVAPGAPSGDDAFVSEEEFREFVDRAAESDMIEDNEAELIHSVFDFGDTLVRSVMVPRTDIVSIATGADLETAMGLFLRSGYSRIPVIGENTDQIRGILYLKDVAAAMYRGEPGLQAHDVDSLARDVRYVPESKPVSDLLRELQQESTHVAIVIDEYGGTAGLVTLEDLIEEIVGEIVDEYDAAAEEAVDLGDGQYRVSARMSIDDLGELFDIDLDDDEVDTVGGLLAKALGQVPIVGSSVEVNGVFLKADRLEGRRNRVSHIIAAAMPKEDTDLEDLLDDADSTQQGVPREQAK
ncbi:membrane protein [Arthrobacter sp. StoSoilB3]|uniref:CBS domain containing-hemolysin-like protein n=1 Tax=Paenarthrobacter nicotinovorans TaxID=29320 RepID=A0ABT9TIT8_PAENI|nr:MULTISPECIES: hemolysin family protein [Paenarthrobacter]KIA73346.1 integral membrane transporter [Arthrobacter sp. MWB30]KQQ99675.1 HCC family HlyC/CorC transporter [Arthrobacter sp. Leaf145]SKB61909.1 Hemolysin, contains CBS domains [Arthrobacter sp. 31Cvi3.1E]BCW10881.1 membrane protein [Arthrobacter sp. NtRootA2]BCW14964.1 membrane protein [Arthrobacter sp. NtRootA4]BCW23299.1 membrane protein [Arthrobacter sp. NtRootC7]BCW27567.1 membrane protein [Arthrobacter sp. NtRootC45]BCW31834